MSTYTGTLHYCHFFRFLDIISSFLVFSSLFSNFDSFVCHSVMYLPSMFPIIFYSKIIIESEIGLDTRSNMDSMIMRPKMATNCIFPLLKKVKVEFRVCLTRCMVRGGSGKIIGGVDPFSQTYNLIKPVVSWTRTSRIRLVEH